jgi:uncharacterized protein YndB with AHSA1/START domain
VNPTLLEAEVVVELPASPERVFGALASSDITQWWVRPGVFDTREWIGDVRVGGAWHASGIGRGNPYTLDGEFTLVDPPQRLAHTWRLGGMPLTTNVTYELEPIATGTRLTLRHGSFPSRELCEANRIGWETSFEALRRLFEK